VIGPPESYAGMFPDRTRKEWGFLALYVPDRGGRLEVGTECTARIVVTGANFDAVTFEGKFSLRDEADVDPDTPDVIFRTFRWTVEPKPASWARGFAALGRLLHACGVQLI